MPWAVAGAVVSAAGSVGGGILGGDAAQKAAQIQVSAANNATNAELGMYNQTVAREAPFVSAGTNALADLQRLLGIGSPGGPSSPVLEMLGLGPGGTGQIDPSKFQGSPGYNYQLQQGTNAVTNSAAAHGGLGGNALRALQSAGQGLASQSWNQYLGNASGAFQTLLGNLGGLVTGGQNAAGNLGSLGGQVGGQIGSNAIGAGNAGAAGTIGGANALAGGINGAGTNFSALLQSPQFAAALKGLFNGGGSSSAGSSGGGVGGGFGVGGESDPFAGATF